MKKVNGLVLRQLGNEYMIVAESLDLVNFDRLVSLNDSAAYVWESLGEDIFDSLTVSKLLTERYEVDEDTALRDAKELLDTWLNAGVIEN